MKLKESVGPVVVGVDAVNVVFVDVDTVDVVVKVKDDFVRVDNGFDGGTWNWRQYHYRERCFIYPTNFI